MKKVSSDTNFSEKFANVSFDIEGEINKLKNNPLFKDMNINILNLNDYLFIDSQIKSCLTCKCLDNCSNKIKGYTYTLNDGRYVLTPCRYLNKQNENIAQSSLFKSKYLSSNLDECNLDEFKLTTQERKKAYDYALKFVSNFGEDKKLKGLYVWGAFSSGKTYFLASICKELSKKGVSSLLIYYPELCRILKQNMFSDKIDEMIDELKSVDVLLLDDFGGEVLTSWLRDEILGPVLNYRMQEHKPIFISSNLSIKELYNHLSKAKDENIADDFKAGRIIERIKSLTIESSFGNNRYNL